MRFSAQATLLRPGGIAVITTRPWRQRGELVDFPGAVLATGAAAGLIPVERCIALLAGLRDGMLVPRPSFFQLRNLREARARGKPCRLIAHEDVLIFREPGFPGSSHELKGPQRELEDPEQVHATELGELAKDFMTEAVRLDSGIAPHAIHADRGTSMTSKPVSALLSDLAILRSHSRPKVSNDNPYSEAQFKTLKYCPAFPGTFGSLQDARAFCGVYFT